METPTTATKLTTKQAILTLLLQAGYFLLGPLMKPDDPRRAEIERLLDDADLITGDYPDVLQRRARHLDPAAQRDILEYLDRRAVVCYWKLQSDEWGTYGGSCGVEWCFEANPADDPELNYCPKCGRKLVILEPEQEKLSALDGGEMV